MKKFTELQTTEEFIDYYINAKKEELRNRLKNLEKRNSTQKTKNETDAIKALLI